MWGSIINGLSSMGSAFADKSEGREQFRKQANLQREFAQNGLTWKIDDAWRNKHRIHPLVAMGANTISASPISVRGANVPRTDSSGLGKYLDSKTFSKGKLAEEKAYSKEDRALDLERKRTEIELLKKELNSNGLNPNKGASNSPFDYTNQSSTEQDKPLTSRSTIGVEKGVQPLYTYYDDPDGHMVLTYGKDASEPVESDMFVSAKQNIKRLVKYMNQLKKGIFGSTGVVASLAHDAKKVISTLPPLKDKTKTYKWNIIHGNPQIVKKSKSNTGIFTHEILNKRVRSYYKSVVKPYKKRGRRSITRRMPKRP